MDQEIINTFLGVIRIPAWLEASLAVLSIAVFLFLSFRKSRAQVEALESLQEACKQLCAQSRESVIASRNLNEAIVNRLESDAELNGHSADLFVLAHIDSVFYQVQNFVFETKGSAPQNIIESFLTDCFVEFASKLSRVKNTNGKKLGDFALICRWYFEEKLKDHLIYNQDKTRAPIYIREQLIKEWDRWR